MLFANFDSACNCCRKMYVWGRLFRCKRKEEGQGWMAWRAGYLESGTYQSIANPNAHATLKRNEPCYVLSDEANRILTDTAGVDHEFRADQTHLPPLRAELSRGRSALEPLGGQHQARATRVAKIRPATSDWSRHWSNWIHVVAERPDPEVCCAPGFRLMQRRINQLGLTGTYQSPC